MTRGEAILVTGLVTQRVMRRDFATYHTCGSVRPLIASDGQLLETMEEVTVQQQIVPITQFCFGNGNPNLYVAYTEEVEQLLGIPFRIILREKADAEAENRRLRGLTAWQHIKAAYNIIMAAIGAFARKRAKP